MRSACMNSLLQVFFLIFIGLQGVQCQAKYPIVSLLDSSSVHSTLLKVYSIIENTKQPKLLSFHFLLFSPEVNPDLIDDRRVSIRSFERLFIALFPSVSYEVKHWKPSFFLLKHLRDDDFEKEIIFARFYLPEVFSALPRFLYLDNDVVLNMDVIEVFQRPQRLPDLSHLAIPQTNRKGGMEGIQTQAVPKPTKTQIQTPTKTDVDTEPDETQGRTSVDRSKSKARIGKSGKQRYRNNDVYDARRQLATPQYRPNSLDNQRSSGIDVAGQNRARKRQPQGSVTSASSSFKPAVSMVFELHPFYLNYLRDHFNQTHPFYQTAYENVLKAFPAISSSASLSTSPFSMFSKNNDKKEEEKGEKKGEKLALFLNGGVILYDTAQWKRLKLTERAKDIIKRNSEEKIYSSDIGDQAVFYLLFFNNTPQQQQQAASRPIYSFLPPQYNMRRLPKKTIHLLQERIQGIIHFAGISHGNAVNLCKTSTHHPILVPAALPYYLSLVHSFVQRAKDRSTALKTAVNSTVVLRELRFLQQDLQPCIKAVAGFKNHLTSENVTVSYHPGLGQFAWPPF
eukprot:gene5848-6288_t